MDFEQPKTEEKDSALDKFHQEIQKLKEEEKEMEKKQAEDKTGNVHLRGLNPEELTREDMDIYAKFKNLALTQEEYYKWKQGVVEEMEKIAPKDMAERLKFFDRNSRNLFVGYLGNKIPSWKVWEEKKRELEAFRDEVAGLKEIEIKKMENKETYDPHLASIINPQKLTVHDLEMFKRLKEGSFSDTSDDFRSYREEIFRECRERFQQEATKHEKLKKIIIGSNPKDSKELLAFVEENEPLMRFQAIFSRTNFLAWILNEYVSQTLQKSREKRRQKKNQANQT